MQMIPLFMWLAKIVEVGIFRNAFRKKISYVNKWYIICFIIEVLDISKRFFLLSKITL